MSKSENWFKKLILAVIACSGWLALSVQFYINMTSGVAGIPELLNRYFSYFTILTNLMVSLCCTSLLINTEKGWGIFFAKPATLTAITVYIVIVGIIYNFILRFLWQPQGWQRVVDELLHSVNPALFFVFWLLFVIKDRLQWKQIFSWLIYPLTYLVYILTRGAMSGFYPYPFVDVTRLGFSKVLENCIGITLVFITVSAVLVSIGKWQHKK